MTKLRNIGYLRFGSKIRQGFAVATLSLTPRFPFSLYGCCLLKIQVWGDLGGPRLLYWGWELAALLPGGRPPAAPLTGGRGLHLRGGRPPAAPLPGGRVQTCKL